jgi:hypothetical protein
MASSSLAAVPRPYSAYFGPSVRMVRPMQDSPLEIIEGALDDLVQLVTLSEAPGPTSHTAVVAEGLDSAQAPVALARYLLGVLAGAVQLDTSLSGLGQKSVDVRSAGGLAGSRGAGGAGRAIG